MKITGHCIVKNEDKWVWFAINSVLPFVDKILVYDTGSTDNTVEVIKTIKSSKVVFEEKGPVNAKQLVDLRREQLEKTQTDWFLILDGDEVWPEDQIKKIIYLAKKSDKKTIAYFNKARNCIGDVFHFLSEDLGEYEIAGVRGNLNTRLIRKTPDLKIVGEYPLEAYVNDGGPIQNQKGIKFADCWYLHASFLKRSSGIEKKVSGSFGKQKTWQSGKLFKKTELPKVLYKKYPSIVDDPLVKRSLIYELLAKLTTPLLILKKTLK